MLSKTKDENIWSNVYTSSSSGWGRGASNTPTKKREYTLTKDGKIKLHAAYYNMSSNGGKLYFKVNGETIYSYEYNGAKKIEPFEYISPKLNAGDTFEVRMGSYGTTTQSTFYNPTTVDISDIIVAPFVKGYPQKLNNIGELSIITIYGNYINNSYKGGIMLEKSNSANSGEIALPNAVGFIKVYFNGEYIKIPYYGG